MKITFDPEKRAETLITRGLDMAESAEVWDGLHLTYEDKRRDYGEPRLITLGYLNARLVFIAWTYRGATRRIISMRKANGREQRKYIPLLGK